MLISEHIAAILYVTGVITASVVVQFFFPAKALKILNQIEIRDEAGLLFARHWGMLALTIGALLIYAGAHPEARPTIMLLATIEKVALVGLIVMDFKKPYTRGLRLTAVFDGLCSVIYALYLAGVM